jgi:hypothetical protein
MRTPKDLTITDVKDWYCIAFINMLIETGETKGVICRRVLTSYPALFDDIEEATQYYTDLINS